MNWKVGDVALIQCYGPTRDKIRVEGEFCTLRKFVGDQKTAEGKSFIPDAWMVQIHAPGMVDMVLVSQYALQKIRPLNKKVEWSECPWQPLEHARYP